MNRFWRFLKEEDGLEMSEYALMGALICVAIAGTVILLQGGIDRALNGIVAVLPAAP